MSHDAQLTARVKAEAEAVGFARVGVAQAGALDEEGMHLDAWLAAGRHGQMSWMATTALPANSSPSLSSYMKAIPCGVLRASNVTSGCVASLASRGDSSVSMHWPS